MEYPPLPEAELEDATLLPGRSHQAAGWGRGGGECEEAEMNSGRCRAGGRAYAGIARGRYVFRARG